MNHQFEEYINDKLKDIVISDRLKKIILEKTIKNHRNCLNKSVAFRRRYRKRFIIPITVCICLLCASAVIAAVPQLREQFIRFLSPNYESITAPVSDGKNAHQADMVVIEDSGIQVKIKNAVRDDKTVVIYAAIRDLTGSRLDQSMSIFEYQIGEHIFSNSQLIGIDDKTQTADFCFIATGEEGQDLVDFQISSIASGSRDYEEFDTGIPVAKLITADAEGQYVPSYGGGGDREMMKQLRKRDGTHVLVDGNRGIKFRPDIDFVSISEVGYLDGYLHIQTKWSKGRDNHGDVALVDREGNRVPSIGLSFGQYIEYIYEIPEEKVKDCTLRAFFVEEGIYLEGNWNASLSVKSVADQTLEIEYKEIADKISITPIGIYLDGTELVGDNCEIVITMQDDSYIEIAAVHTMDAKNGKNLIFIAREPINMEQIKQVRVNKIVIDG